ncbi:TetR/AcrR family transcriptional regulator [Bacteroides sp.]|uniref:TetR/AcrR family transcriptional regulator n=1 Tax=Bacteroides sp. TaxID=29523 RepID=UPI00402A532B
MEKEITKNRQATEMTLIKAVNNIIEESGFEGLGINAVAAKAKVSKMLIYRYFNSLDGLIAAYIQQNDYWINFDEELPDQAHLAAFIKQIFKRQIMRLRENYTLKRLYRWELTTDNKFVKELRNKREEKGIWLVEAVSKLSNIRNPKSAKEGDANYSGGKEGSGQPALVYAAEVDLTSGKKEFTAKLIGHSSPDGSNGDLTKDTSSLTTALHIVKSITVYVQ